MERPFCSEADMPRSQSSTRVARSSTAIGRWNKPLILVHWDRIHHRTNQTSCQDQGNWSIAGWVRRRAGRFLTRGRDELACILWAPSQVAAGRIHTAPPAPVEGLEIFLHHCNPLSRSWRVQFLPWQRRAWLWWLGLLPIGRTAFESSTGYGSGCSPGFVTASVTRMRQLAALHSQPCCLYQPSTARDGLMPFHSCLTRQLPSWGPSSQVETDSRARLDHRSMDIWQSSSSSFHFGTISRSLECQQDPWLPACLEFVPLASGP